MGKINYLIEIEIFQANGCEVHKAGEKFKYPDDSGSICPWLMDSMNSMIRVLQFGGNLPWKYSGTPYEKLLNFNNELTTEFIRCPDPTQSGVVAKIIRRKLGESIEVVWC